MNSCELSLCMVCCTVFDDTLLQSKIKTMYGISDQISGKIMSVKILRLTFENVIFVGKRDICGKKPNQSVLDLQLECN